MPIIIRRVPAGRAYGELLEASYIRKEDGNLKGIVTGVAYMILFLGVIGAGFFVFLATLATDDRSGEAAPDLEYIGSKYPHHHRDTGDDSGTYGSSAWREITRRPVIFEPRSEAPVHRETTTRWPTFRTVPDEDTTTPTEETPEGETPEEETTEEETPDTPEWPSPETGWPRRTTRATSPTQVTPRPLPSGGLSGTELATLYINGSLDWHHQPCKDFYSFVCGKYTGATSVAEKLDVYTKQTVKRMLLETDVTSSGQTAFIKAASLFKACNSLSSRLTNTEVHLLKRFLSNLGLDLSDMSYDVEFDTLDRVASLSLEYGIPVFVKFRLFVSPPDIPDYILEMEINGEEEDWLREAHSKGNVVNLEEMYHDYLSDYDRSLLTTRVIESIISSERIIYDFLKELRQERFTATKTTVENLGTFTKGSVSKAHWIWMILHYTSKTYRAEDAVLLWDNAPAVAGLLMDSSRLPRQDARILLAWTLLRRLLPLAHSARLAETAKKWSGGEDFMADYCYELVSKAMAMAVTHQYVKTFLKREVLASARDVLTSLMDALVDKITNAPWIQQPVRSMALRKTKRMRLQLAHPDEYSNDTLVEKFYAHFPQAGKEFFAPYMASLRILTMRKFRGHINARCRPLYANAFYSFDQNAVKLYAGIMQLPLFIFEAPAAVNYGGLGQIIGHELMHAFDVRGIAYDEVLHPVNFQDTSTMKHYQDKVLCLRAAYERTESPSRARTLNDGTDTEGFADYVGLLLAQAALQSLPAGDREANLPGIHLTAKQLFFVAHCIKWCTPGPVDGTRQPSSPSWAARSRCIVPLQNTREFADEFRCQPGDVMNPSERCSFW